jgi:DNA-binding transcriptional MerR regulator
MQRAGNRRYYRPADVELARRIHRLLNEEGYTVRGVQKLLRDKSEPAPETAMHEAPAIPMAEPSPPEPVEEEPRGGIDVYRLIALRNRLAAALER